MKTIKFTHKYRAIVTHEVEFSVPDEVPDETAWKWAIQNGKYPINTEAKDEDFLEDVSWELN